MKLRLLLVLLAPAAAAGQPLQGAAGIGEGLRQMDRLSARPSGLPQTFVIPERPGQNQVNWYDFQWRHFDVASPSGGRGGVRLYYYERERASAERALPVIRNAYLRLVDQFHYTPTKQIPYILYSSKREFQTTNVFQVSESVLGVTSPGDLKMSLPYFGDHEKFREVSTHEMVHQFTIQKLLDIAGTDQLQFIDNLPLWFIEGIAEYYTKGGIDSETDLFLRDLVWNPDPERGYEMLAFADDRARGYIPTYKLGQARVAFIADVYGKEKIQALLENAYLVGGARSGGRGEQGFAALARRVLNDTPEQVDARWRTWLKRRYYPEYMRTRQDLQLLRDYVDLPAEPEAYTASADGWLVFYRGIDREQRRVHLYLLDVRNPRGALEVAGDNQPGLESLHPVEQNVLAIGAGKLAFTAQDGSSDSLYVVPFRHTPPKEKQGPRLALGPRRKVELRHPEGLRFIEVSDPAFSPDGNQIAFVGLTDRGQRDVYVVAARGGAARQITNDPYAERDLAWGADGIYLASDGTDHGGVNLFRLDEASGALTRLTTGPATDRHPRPQADGSVLFSGHAGGKPDLFLLRDGKVRRLTDFATGLEAPAASPNARGIFASTFYRGRFRLVEVPKVAWLDEPPVAVAAVTAPPLEIPRESLPETAPRYDALSLKNWSPDRGYAFGGGGGGRFGGQAVVLFTDLLRDRLLFVNVAVLGSFDLTQALVLYENREQRTGWVLGAFHYVNDQLDRLNLDLAYFQRDFGVAGALRFPLDRFRRVDVELQLGGTERYCPTQIGQRGPICSGFQTGSADANDRWRAANRGMTASVGPSVRFGYDTVRLDAVIGPISGSSLVLEVGGLWHPNRNAISGFARLDAGHWFQIVGRTNLMFRAAAGSSFAPDDRGRNWARSWWLSSADNLRGYFPFEKQQLVGLNYYVANAELRLPLDALIRTFLFEHLVGVAALDFGGVFNTFPDQTECSDGVCLTAPGAWRSRTLTGVLGLNAYFGPLVIRLHFGHPFDIGGAPTPAMVAGTSWVWNLTLGWAYF